MKITAHTLVKNEARYVWFSVMSVIEHVDKVLLWDTGSTDSTKLILKEIKKRYPQKVDLKFLESIDVEKFRDVRQRMLDETNSDWFIVVDGDEIWWEDSIKKIISTIKERGSSIESIVARTVNLIGDMYHYQEEAAGKYRLAGRRGHFNIRAVNRNIDGLHSDRPHGTWGWVDKDKKMIQDRDQSKIVFVDVPYLHATFLPRAGGSGGDELVPKRAQKLKYEIGIPLPSDFYYPESFFRKKSDMILSPWFTMSPPFRRKALWQTPLKKIKRRILPDEIGY